MPGPIASETLHLWAQETRQATLMRSEGCWDAFSNAKLANSVVLGSLAAKFTQDGCSIFWVSEGKPSCSIKESLGRESAWMTSDSAWYLSQELCPKNGFFEVNQWKTKPTNNRKHQRKPKMYCPMAQASPLLATFMPVQRRLRVPTVASSMALWTKLSWYQTIPPPNKNAMRLGSFFTLPTHLSETWQFNHWFFQSPFMWHGHLDHPKSAKRNDGRDSRTDRLWPLLPNGMGKKHLFTIMIILEKVFSKNGINSLKL